MPTGQGKNESRIPKCALSTGLYELTGYAAPRIQNLRYSWVGTANAQLQLDIPNEFARSVTRFVSGFCIFESAFALDAMQKEGRRESISGMRFPRNELELFHTLLRQARTATCSHPLHILVQQQSRGPGAHSLRR